MLCSVLLSWALGGCASAASAVATSRATRAVESAKGSGAGTEFPYQVALAEAYLDKAREESAEAQYLDAIHLAKRGRARAEEAVEAMRTQRKGQGAKP